MKSCTAGVGILFLASALSWLANARLAMATASDSWGVGIAATSERCKRNIPKRKLMTAEADQDEPIEHTPAPIIHIDHRNSSEEKKRGMLRDCMAVQENAKPFASEDFIAGKPAR